VPVEGLEPPTSALRKECSFHLSYTGLVDGVLARERVTDTDSLSHHLLGWLHGFLLGRILTVLAQLVDQTEHKISIRPIEVEEVNRVGQR
jgi:hypothetical protein